MPDRFLAAAATERLWSLGFRLRGQLDFFGRPYQSAMSLIESKGTHVQDHASLYSDEWSLDSRLSNGSEDWRDDPLYSWRICL